MIARVAAAAVLVVGLVAIAWTILADDEPGTDVVAQSSTPDDRASTTEPTTEPTSSSPASPVAAPENLGPRRDLVGLDGWLNTEDIDSLDDLDGQVVLVEMWTFGCSNCKARIPHNQDLYASYQDRGFEIVGVHAPEFSYEAEVANIEQALIDLGVTWPVALDTNKQNFRAWQEGGRRFWPRTFVIDQNGDVRFDHIGEGKYDELEQTVAWLLNNPPT